MGRKSGALSTSKTSSRSSRPCLLKTSTPQTALTTSLVTPIQEHCNHKLMHNPSSPSTPLPWTTLASTHCLRSAKWGETQSPQDPQATKSTKTTMAPWSTPRSSTRKNKMRLLPSLQSSHPLFLAPAPTRRNDHWVTSTNCCHQLHHQDPPDMKGPACGGCCWKPNF